MLSKTFAVSASAALIVGLLGAEAAIAAKSGGTLDVIHRRSPPSASPHEEATIDTVTPFMGVFNGLVMFDQAVANESLDTIVPDLATSWSWNADGTQLTFKLRSGVKWHDGKPFTAADVKCTWETLLGQRTPAFRKNPRKAWYVNLEKITTSGDSEATFHLQRPQPSFVGMLASGYSPVYPCHVDPKTQRTNPIGTGPFKFVELKQNESIKLVRNPDYWKEGRPYLDGINWTIIRAPATRDLAFVAGKFDLTYQADLSVPRYNDMVTQTPDAVCKLYQTGVTTNLIVNRDAPPFDDERVRTAMLLALDRGAFSEILQQGLAQLGGAMMPPPAGNWGMTPEFLKTVGGYGPDIEANRAKARGLLKEAGFGPDNPLKMKVSTRDIQVYRDPAVILIDHLKTVGIEAELEPVDNSLWHAKVGRKDYAVGLNLTGVGVDDPDVNFFENYACGSERNYTGYCNQELQKAFEAQSQETDAKKRLAMVWEIDKKLQEDAARPIIYHGVAGTCMKPDVKGLVIHENSLYNAWRFEDVWLDR